MNKIILILLLITATALNATSLNYDEFDIQKMGKTFEAYVIENDKKIKNYDLKIKELSTQIKSLQKRIKQQELKNEEQVSIPVTKKNTIFTTIPKELAKEVVSRAKAKETLAYEIAQQVIREELSTKSDIFIVNRRAGVTAYEKPNSKSPQIKIYKYEDEIYIEFCDKYGWCKILNKVEFVSKYLLKDK